MVINKKAVYHCVQLIGSFFKPLWVIAVDHKYQTLMMQTYTLSPTCLSAIVIEVQRLLDHLDINVIMSPQRPDDSLTPNIPNSEADVLVLHCLDIKT